MTDAVRQRKAFQWLRVNRQYKARNQKKIEHGSHPLVVVSDEALPGAHVLPLHK